MKAATGIRYEATPPPTSAQIKASQRMVQYEDRPIPTPSPPKASKPKPVSEPKPDPDAKPDFRYFADWIEGEAKHIFAADEWKGIVKHKPQMPAVYRNRVIDCLKSLADQVNDKIAEFEEVPTKH